MSIYHNLKVSAKVYLSDKDINFLEFLIQHSKIDIMLIDNLEKIDEDSNYILIKILCNTSLKIVGTKDINFQFNTYQIGNIHIYSIEEFSHNIKMSALNYFSGARFVSKEVVNLVENLQIDNFKRLKLFIEDGIKHQTLIFLDLNEHEYSTKNFIECISQPSKIKKLSRVIFYKN